MIPAPVEGMVDPVAAEEIRRLQIDYATRLDARDLPGYSELFAPDGEWHGGYGVARGPAEVLAMMREMLDDEVGREYHVITNQQVDPVPGAVDAARASCSFLVVTRGETGAPYVRILGFYEDDVRRVDGRWRFAKRVVHVAMPAESP